MNQLFYIFKLGEDEAKEIAESPFETMHKHDYEELIVGIEGSLDHFIDFRSEKFNSPFISFVTKGKLHRAKPETSDGKCSIWVIQFRSEFIPQTTFHLYSYFHSQSNIQLLKGDCFSQMGALCEMMFIASHNDIPNYAVVRHLLSALFAMIETERKKMEPDETSLLSTQNITFKNFLKILEENFRRSEGVEFYAEKLFMSVRNLNLICQNILQQSVSEIIETRKLIEAKNLLISTDKTISEIGYELGYNEKSYFTSVFKKKSGQTPSDFRDEMSKLIS
jgi:AraC family transcriptional regulator, transcriptional activator of pobA